MKLINRSDYDDIEQEFDISCLHFFRKDFLSSYRTSNELIEKISQFKKVRFFSSRRRFEILGTLTYIRAYSYKENNPDDVSLFSYLVREYNMGAEILEENKILDHFLFDILFALSDLYLDESLRQGTSYVEQAFDCLSRAEIVANIFNESVKQEMLVKIDYSKARCYDWPVPENSLASEQKALSYFKKCFDYYTETRNNYLIMYAAFRMANILSEKHYRELDEESFNFSILYYTTALEQAREFEGRILGDILFELGCLYLFSGSGYIYLRCQKSYDYLSEACQIFQDRNDRREWLRSGVYMIRAYFLLVFLEQPKQPDKHEFNHHYDLLLLIIRRLIQIRDFEELRIALSTKRWMDFELKIDPQNDEELTRQLIIQQLEGMSQFDALYIDIKLEQCFLQFKDGNYEKLTGICLDIIQNVEEDSFPTEILQAYISLAFSYWHCMDQIKADFYFDKAVRLALRIREENSSKNHLQTEEALIYLNEIIAKLNWVKTDSVDDLSSVVQSIEVFRYHQVSIDLENHYCIENLTAKYSIKRGLGRVRGSKAVSFLLKKETQKIEFEAALSETGVLDLIKSTYPELTEVYFLKNLDTHLKKVSSWILIPIWSERIHKFLLIPPNSGLSDVIISKEFSVFGLNENVENETAPDLLRCWVSDFLYYQDSLNKIENDHNLSDWEKGLEENQLESRNKKVSKKVQEHLWKVLGSWITNIASDHKFKNCQNPQPLAIISQGAYMYFPFCLAQNPEQNSESISHYFDMSYFPSLYSIFTIQERLKAWKGPEKLCFMKNPDSESKPNYFSIEQHLCNKPFKETNGTVINNTSMELKSVFLDCDQSTYWHLSTHGYFSHAHSSRSYIEGEIDSSGGKDIQAFLTPEIITSLDSRYSLRLVFMSCCETATFNVHENALSPKNYLIDILRTGTLGAIGSLWATPQIAATLISSRFYYFHIKLRMRPDMALNRAQCWLKDIGREELIHYLMSGFDDDEPVQEDANMVIELLENFETDKPFSDPYFWAGFILVGQ